MIKQAMILIALAGVLLAAACAPAKHHHESSLEAYCKTHAREGTVTQSPDEQGLYLECLHQTGAHEIEIREAE